MKQWSLLRPRIRDRFLTRIETDISRAGRDYLAVIKGLTPDAAAVGTDWLQGIVDMILARSHALLPALSP